MAGFGGSSSTKKSSSPPKLKAKAQWDRYLAMKQVESFPVGVKDKTLEDWLVVGKVRSQDVTQVSQATARQRALLAEHAKRLHPLQISSQMQLEWGFQNETGTWTIVDPKEADDLPNAFDKTIGFQGIADPNTGFYCVSLLMDDCLRMELTNRSILSRCTMKENWWKVAAPIDHRPKS